MDLDTLAAAVAAPFDPDYLRDPGPVPNGYFTLTLPDGSHRTLKVWTTARGGRWHGRRVMGLLIGPENTSDYEVFGYVNRDGITPVRSRWVSHRHEFYAGLIWAYLASGEEWEGHALAVSRRCLVCGRDLTDPASIEKGIGPTCRKNLGID